MENFYSRFKGRILPLRPVYLFFFFSFFSLNAFAQPSNDDPCNAITIFPTNTCTYLSFDNINATPTTGVPSPGCASYQGGDVWFRVTVPCTGSLVFDMQEGTFPDAGMAIYSGTTCTALTLIECDDDDGTGNMSYIARSGLTPGSTIWVRIWEFGGDASGTFGICITMPPPPGPGGSCNNASGFCTSNVYTFPNSTSQPSLGGGGIYGCLGSTPNPVWYYMQVQTNGNITIDMTQTDAGGNLIDVDFAIWGPFTNPTGACGQLTAANIVDCSYSTAGAETGVIPNAQAGEYYMFLLTNFSDDPGTITFQQNTSVTNPGSTTCNVICTITGTGPASPVCPSGTFNMSTTTVTGATYSWLGPNCFSLTGQTGTTATATAPNTPGTYPYIVTANTPGGSNCFDTIWVVVSGLSATYTTTPISCPNANDATITVTPNPAGNYTYTLNPGNVVQVNNPVFTGLAPNNYSVTVTSPTGCSVQLPNILITTAAGPGATYTKTNTSCPGVNDGTITITPALPGSYTYTLNPGAIVQINNPVFTGLATGTYSVLVTNSAGCTRTLSNIQITAGAGPTATFTSNATTCQGANNGTITITPTGTAPHTFTLNPGNIVQVNNPVFAGLAPGNYSINFSTANGCTGSVPIIAVATGPALTGTHTSSNTTCSGVNNGSITITPTIAGTYNYVLTPGGTSNTTGIFSNLAPGIYSVTATNSLGCSFTRTGINIIFGPPLTSSVIKTNPPCAGINDGQVTINPTSGTGPFNFSLSGVGANNSGIFTGLSPNITYNYTFSDAIGCTGTGSFILTTNPPLRLTVTNTLPLCNGNSNGSIRINASGGVAPYEYAMGPAFTSFQQASTFSGLPTGTYSFRIRDAVGCIKDTVAVFLNEPAVLIASASSPVPSTCFGNDGQLRLSAVGGTTPYQYSMNGTSFQASPTFIAPAIGTYSVLVVKDAKGCRDTTVATVVLNDTMRLSLGPDTTVCVRSSKTIRPNVNIIAASAYVWEWYSTNAPNSTIADTTVRNAVVTPVDTSEYVLHLTWGLCQRWDTIIVNVLHEPIAHAGEDTAICYRTAATFHGSATNTSGPVIYTWTPASFLSSVSQAVTQVSPPDAGTYQYTLSVEDDYGCNFLTTDDIRLVVTPPVPAYAGHDTIAVAGVPHQLYGSGGVQYVWSPAGVLNSGAYQNPLATIYDDTRFTLQVMDIAGCIGWDTVFVKVYAGPTYYLPNAFTPNGDGRNDIFRPIPVGIVSTEYFRVFDRYGKLVFETKEWLKGWDGRYLGRKQPVGTYVWMIKGADRDGKIVQKKGTVMLVQ
ncbi:MAG: gliding motility-associated C-terminal domain-containing protein [Ferruginibacter sp.]